VNSEKKTEPPLFPEEKMPAPPARKAVLAHLAQTLSVSKTLKRFPALKAEDLQAIFQHCARLVSREDESPRVPFPAARFGEISIHVDGASRGNPGEAGAGVVIADESGRTLKEWKGYLGVVTNNVAEYRALLLALEKASPFAAKRVIINLDSELVVRQLLGEYKVRQDHLRPLYEKARELLAAFPKHEVRHIPREENRRADQLANEAIDQKIRI
jgi:ribonuclease HI